MSDPLPAPAFSAGYNVPLTDIGSGYAAGIKQASTSIAEAIGSVSDIAKQNLDTNDTLTAMHQSGILGADEYNSVMGKSLGARQSMLGLYAGQWIADQASRRALGLTTGQEHAKLAEQIATIRAGYGRLVGYDPAKLPAQPAGKAPVVPTAPAIKSAQPVSPAEKLAGVPGAPTPLGSPDITNPLAAGVIIGSPFGGKEAIPPGAKTATLRGQRGYVMPDGRTFRPMQ
jgi:hypothetical protein